VFSSGKQALLLVLLGVLGVLTACNPAPKNVAPTIPGVAPTNPPVTLTIEQAQQVAGDFLNAWALGSHEAMYNLLHIKSRDATPKAEFDFDYQSLEQTLTVIPNGIQYKFLNVIQQGASAQIAYEITFKTRIFGEFKDSDRLLTLEATPQGWRVAWTEGDLFREMRDGAVLFVEQQRPNRGNIYDRNGIALADQSGVLIDITLLTEKYPTNNPEACFAELARVIPARSAEKLKTTFGAYTGRPQAYEIGTINSEQFNAEKPRLEQVCKLSYKALPARAYPYGGIAPHIVGHIGKIPAERAAEYASKGYSADALVGIDGIERDWEEVLAGRGAATLTLRKSGQVVRKLAESPAVLPQSVYLTIDLKLQNRLQNALKEAWSSSAAYFYTSKGGAAIIMDVHTGEILAMASYPDFDQNIFNPYTTAPDVVNRLNATLEDPRTPLLNRATMGTYPLGSVFKIVSMAAAADSGKFNMNTLFTCTGVWDGKPLGDRFRTDWIYKEGPGQHGTINLKQALIGSCDPYFWRIGWTLNGVDPNLLPNYAKQMGFGALTGIRGVSEATGQIPDPNTYPQTYAKKWTGSDALDFVIGQGTMLVTPLQTVRMVAGIANEGKLLEPLIVKKTGQIGTITYEAKPIQNGDMKLKPGVIDGIRDAMCDVVTDRTLGTAYFVYTGFKGAVVCGKTGTAESGQANPHAWFAAYAGRSEDKPEIALVAIVENSYEGSFMAAPLVKHMVEMYYNLPYSPWPAWWGAQSLRLDDDPPVSATIIPTLNSPRAAP
jgi:penicillin-binding protein 2